MFDRAAKLEKAFRRYPRAPLFARLADQYLRKGRLLRAQVLCEEGCERFPRYPTGYFILGQCYEQQKMWEEARSALDRGLRLDPDNPAGYRQLSRVYRQLGNGTLALKCLERAAGLDPLSEPLANELARLAAEVRTDAPAAGGGQDHGTSDEILEPSAPPVAEPSDTQEAEEGLFDGDPDAGASGSDDAGAESSPVLEPLRLDDALVADFAQAAPSIEPAAEEPMTAEPFGVLQSVPEWEEPTVVEPSADGPQVVDEPHLPAAPQGTDESHSTDEPPLMDDTPLVAEPPAVAELSAAEAVDDASPVGPPFDEEIASSALQAAPGSDEVAALGAGLFDDAEDTTGEDTTEQDTTGEDTTGEDTTGEDTTGEDTTGEDTTGEDTTEQDTAEEDTTGEDVTEVAVEPEVAAVPPPPPADSLPTVASLADEPAAAETPDVETPAAEEPVVQRPAESPAPAPAVTSPMATPALEMGPTAQSGKSARTVTRLTRPNGDELAALLRQIDLLPPPEQAPAEEYRGPVPTVTLAELYIQQGFSEEAQAVYERLLAADPGNESARRGLAALHEA